MAWSLTDDVSTVLAWWDGSDGSTITTDGSGGIDQVDDKSGNEHHLDSLGSSTNKLTVQAARCVSEVIVGRYKRVVVR